jgi:ABC-type phosphate transport system substrate-binding protein
MKLAKYIFVVAPLVVSLAAQLNAQVLAANVAGSSALWLEAGQAVWNVNHCTWTSTTSGVTFATDMRQFLNDNGNLWVGWTTGTGGTCAAPAADAQVYAYISLDSSIGVRCLFAQPSCTLNSTAAAGTAGVNKLGTAFPDTPLPANVLSAFNGQLVTVAATDILPADAKFATYITLAQCGPLVGTQFVGLGYGDGVEGPPIQSFYSARAFNPLDFNVFGTDPFTSTAIPAYTVTPVGAVPVVVAVNTVNASGFGSASLTNVTRATLGLVFSGTFVRTADLLPQAFAGLSASYSGITALSLEPLSGTYTTFDHSVPDGKELHRTQDIGNCVNGAQGAITNPMNLTRTISQGGSSTTGTHKRVIGTDEMVSEISAVTDSIGYAFWSAGNFATPTNMKYLTVDGVDPIQDTYTGGTLPTGAALANVTLSHVKDGTYPIWSELRFVSTSSAGLTAAQNLATFATNQVSFGTGTTQPDFIPDAQLNVFHAHFAPVFINFNATNTASDGPRVCGTGSNPEDGGDVGGLVLSLQAGADFCVLKDNYGLAGGVGITNTASFGVRQ